MEAYATGTDTVGFVDSGERFVVLRDMKDGSERTFRLPDGQALEGLFGDVVVTSEVLADRTYRAHLLSWENGRVADRVVAGLPEDAQLIHGHSQSGGDGVLVFYGQGSDQLHAAWIDRSGQARLSDIRPTARSAFSGGRYVQWWQSGRVRVWKTPDFSTPVHDFTVPYEASSAVVGVLGNDLLITRTTSADISSGTAAKRRIVAIPLGGGPERPVFDGVSGSPVFQPDGTLLVARATEGREGPERSVYAVRPAADGAFTADKIADAPRVRTAIRGLTMAQGRLDTLDQLPWNLSRLRRTDISVSGLLTPGPRLDRGTDGYEFPDANCGAAWCKTFQATGDGRLVYRSSERNSLRVLADGASLPAAEVPVAREMYQAHKSHASGRYDAVPVAGSADDGYMTHIQVIDLDTGKPVYTSAGHRSVPAYALTGSTLWLEDEDGGPGAVLSVDVRTGAATPVPRRELRHHGTARQHGLPLLGMRPDGFGSRGRGRVRPRRQAGGTAARAS